MGSIYPDQNAKGMLWYDFNQFKKESKHFHQLLQLLNTNFMGTLAGFHAKVLYLLFVSLFIFFCLFDLRFRFFGIFFLLFFRWKTYQLSKYDHSCNWALSKFRLEFYQSHSMYSDYKANCHPPWLPVKKQGKKNLQF